MARPVRIANCSGFYGDRLAAAREMLAGPVDVLTGDYLAELTMLILWKNKQRDPATGYATTFLKQMEQVLGTCLDRGIKVVVNAGGLNPAGLASRLHDPGKAMMHMMSELKSGARATTCALGVRAIVLNPWR